MRYDAAVVGLGAMGSACAHALAARGARVIAFDRLAPPHGLGSSHGHTRIIREAYYEHPLYVPLVRRAYERWAELERESGRSLFLQTGGLWAGPELGPLVSGAARSAREHGVPHELLDAAAVASRFPAYRLPPGSVAVLEHRAGMLFPEACIEAFHMVARRRGAELRTNERVWAWTPAGGGLAVTTDDGRYEAERVIVAAGPWLPELADELGVAIPLEIERQMSHWFAPVTPNERYGAPRAPVALWELRGGDLFLTMGDEGHGVKCGLHHSGSATSAESVDRVVSPRENDAAREALEFVMPSAGGRLLDARVCVYTNTPDRHFIIDWLRGGRILVLSPCSGHGFKFASAIGEIAAQLVLDGRTAMDLSPFSLSRFR